MLVDHCQVKHQLDVEAFLKRFEDHTVIPAGAIEGLENEEAGFKTPGSRGCRWCCNRRNRQWYTEPKAYHWDQRLSTAKFSVDNL